MYRLLLSLIVIATIPYCAAQEVTQPQFPGGEKALNLYLEQQTAPLSRKNTYASVVVFFYIGTDGKIWRPTVATSYSDAPDFPGDSLALTIVKRLPEWVPGSVNGIPQEMPASVTIQFGEQKTDEYGRTIISNSNIPVDPSISEEEKIEFIVVEDLPKTDFTPPVITADDSIEMKTDVTPQPTENTETQIEIVELSDFSVIEEEPFVVVSSSEEKPFTTVEQMPAYPGGETEFQKYITKNLKYPVIAQESEIEGTVILRFVVEKDGTLSDIRVMRGIYPICDKEALRLMEYCPKWMPGKQNEKVVRTYTTAKITFKM